METIKQINVKNRTYYFYNGIINLDEFDNNDLIVQVVFSRILFKSIYLDKLTEIKA